MKTNLRMTHAYTARIWKEPSPPPHTVYPPSQINIFPNSQAQAYPQTRYICSSTNGSSQKKRVSFKSDDSLVKIFEIPNDPRSSYHNENSQTIRNSTDGQRSRLISCQTIDSKIIDLKTALPGSTLQQRYKLLQQGGVRIMSHFRRLNIINQAATQQRHKVIHGKYSTEKRNNCLGPLTNVQLKKQCSTPRPSLDDEGRINGTRENTPPITTKEEPFKKRSIMSAPCAPTHSLTGVNGPSQNPYKEHDSPLCFSSSLDRYTLRDALRIRADRASQIVTHRPHLTTTGDRGRQRNVPFVRSSSDMLPKIQISAYQSRHIADPSAQYTMHPSRRISKLLAW